LIDILKLPIDINCDMGESLGDNFMDRGLIMKKLTVFDWKSVAYKTNLVLWWI